MPLVAIAGKEPLFAGIFYAPDAWIIGDVQIEEGASVWFTTVIRGDVEPIRIGADTNLQDGVIIHGTSGVSGVSVGSRVTVGHGAILHACTLADDILIGMGATVLDRSIIDREVIVAAGTVVPPGRHLESGFLYLGNPAVAARPLKDSERAWFRSSALKYRELASRYTTMEVLP